MCVCVCDVVLEFGLFFIFTHSARDCILPHWRSSGIRIFYKLFINSPICATPFCLLLLLLFVSFIFWFFMSRSRVVRASTSVSVSTSSTSINKVLTILIFTVFLFSFTCLYRTVLTLSLIHSHILAN